MRLSVVIPNFNRCRTLRANLAWLDRQELPAADFEVLVSDDSSTDGSWEMLQAQSHPYRLRLFQTGAPDGVNGVTWGMNLGLEHAEAPHLLFLDNDMLLAPSALRLLFGAFERWKRERGEEVLIRGWWKDNRWLRRLQVRGYDYHRDVVRNAKLRDLLESREDLRVEQVQTTMLALPTALARQVGGFPQENTEYGFDKVKLFQHKLKEQLGLRFVFEPEIYGLHGPMRGDATRFDYSDRTRRPRRCQRRLHAWLRGSRED